MNDIIENMKELSRIIFSIYKLNSNYDSLYKFLKSLYDNNDKIYFNFCYSFENKPQLGLFNVKDEKTYLPFVTDSDHLRNPFGNSEETRVVKFKDVVDNYLFKTNQFYGISINAYCTGEEIFIEKEELKSILCD